jgi:glycosyltransferase involved in cell wall biosynthesis
MNEQAFALSVVVPAFNEEALLDGAIRQLRATLDALRVPAEIIIVNDGSRDRTGAIADALGTELRGVIVCHQTNQGIGGAFRTGAERATGEYLMLWPAYLMLWPADMPADATDLEPYINQLGRADVIVGVRQARVGYNPVMRFNAWLYPKLVATCFNLHVRDVNWIHAYRRECFLKIHLTQRGIPMLAEALVRLRDIGATFVEVEVAMKERLGGVPSASRWRVMRKTLTGLFGLWWNWRHEQRMMAPRSAP